MFRGFRWQLIALCLALILCLAAAVFRISRQSVATIKATASPSIVASDISESPSATETALPATDGRAPQESDSASGLTASVFREGLIGNVRRINPLFAHLNPPDHDLSSLIFEGLFAINDYGDAVPSLAAEMVISGDGLEYVVRLRDNIFWQDGERFSADDVLYTLTLLGAEEYAVFSSSTAFWRTVEIQKLSADLVRFRLAQPFSSFPVLLTVGILPEHALRGSSIIDLASHPFNLAPIGTGPYQLATVHTEAEQKINALHFQLSPTYRQRPEAQTGYLFRDLIFRFYDTTADAANAYESGAIDALAIADPPERLLSLPHSQHYRQALAELGVLIFNWNDSPFQERRVRQALALSLDLPSLVQAHLETTAVFADSPYVLGSSTYLPNTFWSSYDQERAYTLLAAAELGRSAQADDSEAEADLEQLVPYRLLVGDSARQRGLAEAVADRWRRLGFDFQVQTVDATTFSSRLDTGDFDVAIVSQRIGADQDLFRFWHPAQHDSGSNYGAASHNEIAELIEIARGEIYAGRRALLYQQLQAVFAEQALAIPLYYPLLTYVARDDIEGIKLGFLGSPADRFRGIQHWRPTTLAG